MTRKHGICGLCIDAIAAIAGTCRTVVKGAVAKARALRLLDREERRRRGCASHIQPAREGGWYVLVGSHGWLCGDRRAALNEFHELDRIENHPTYPQQKDYSHERC
jgi:hypothetical protein